MFRNYFKSAYRQLFKNKLFTAVNILGLSTGLASIMVLSVVVYQFVTTNSNMKNIGEMYYLKSVNADGGQYTQTTFPLLGEIVRKCPEVSAATHIQQFYYPWLKYNEKEFQETTTFVDTGYFKVFSFPFKFGDAATALSDKFSIVLSEEIASKFFGNVNPVGKIITADDTLQLKVTGVLQHVPSNSTIRPIVVLPVKLLTDVPDFGQMANWYNTFASNYLRLKPGSDSKKLDAKILDIVNLNYAPEHKGVKVITVPFGKITDEGSTVTGSIVKGSIGAGIFILLIMLVNLVNLNAAGMYSRSKEVAIRQMIGGSKKNIIFQFCLENGLIVLASTFFAWLLFSTLLLPSVNYLVKDSFGEIETGLSKDYPLLFLFAAIALVLTVLAASLPAVKLTAVRITEGVKGNLSGAAHKGSAMRNAFITLQFVLAVVVICVSVIFNRQIAFMKTAALGFDKDDVAVVNLNLAFRDAAAATSRFQSIFNDLKNNPHVKAVSTNYVVPTAYDQNYNVYYDPATNVEVSMRQAPADAGYLPVYKIPLVQGKNFDDELSSSQEHAVIINRSAMNALGWKDAIGKQLKAKGDPTAYTVVGVTEDFHYEDLQYGIRPTVHFYAGKPSLEKGNLSVRTDAGYTTSVMAQLEREFKTMPSRRNFQYELMSDKVDKQYTLLEGLLKVTNALAFLTIIIASMGIFGLIALFARQRVKEIGIRKVLGASAAGIVRLLSKDFLMLVALAILVASPIAWYIMNKWLQDFAYRINISWWMFAVGGLIALVIALLTVSVQAIRAAVANPVKSLRIE